MSLGFTRLNVRKSPPNANIAFIKPLPGPNEAIAQDFLERIAAQCYPVMKNNYIQVRSLEEYEPNREFVGRNFNAGEVVQLVLRSPTSGRWLPFEYVQMVMMHELAHCKQMNHSRSFWAVRNSYARQMESLWSTGYTGEGIWGAGRELSSGVISRPTILASEAVPEHLCGGTYRTNNGRGRKRKAPVLSYKEQKEKRILNKFGANGVAIGADERVKSELEGGRKVAKPRVAGSARGRNLRAAAAAARFEQDRKTKVEAEGDEKPDVIDLLSDSEGEHGPDGPEVPDAVDIDGKRLMDKDGRGMVKTCEDEDAGDDDIKELASNEWQELLKRFRGTTVSSSSAPPVLRQPSRSTSATPSTRPITKPYTGRSASASSASSASSRRTTAARKPLAKTGKKTGTGKTLGFTRTLGVTGDPSLAEVAAAAARRRNGQRSVADLFQEEKRSG